MMHQNRLDLRETGKEVQQAKVVYAVEVMHPILVLYFAFKQEGKAVERRRKSYQW